MSRRPRRNQTPAFKARFAIAAIKGDRTLAALRSKAGLPMCSVLAAAGEQRSVRLT